MQNVNSIRLGHLDLVGHPWLIRAMNATPENLLPTKKAFWKRRESNLSGKKCVVIVKFRGDVWLINYSVSVPQDNKD